MILGSTQERSVRRSLISALLTPDHPSPQIASASIDIDKHGLTRECKTPWSKLKLKNASRQTDESDA
jgi:hypothetical protein